MWCRCFFQTMPVTKSDLMMKAVKQSFSSSLLLLGYDTEELIVHPHFRIKGILFSGKKHSDFMHLILFVDFEYMIPNKTITLSPLSGNAEGEKNQLVRWCHGERVKQLYPLQK